MVNVDPYISAVIKAESGDDPNAVHESGAVGYMQLLPKSFPEYSVEELKNPVTNVMLGTRYLQELADKYGNIEDALSAYHAGPGNFDAWVEAGRPEEGLGNYGPRSLRYASTVLSHYTTEEQPTAEVAPTNPELDVEIAAEVPEETEDDLKIQRQKAFKMEYYNPDNMHKYHPTLIKYAREFFNDNHSSDEDIASEVVSTMRNFENSMGTAYYLADVANATESRKNAFGHMLNYWAEAPDMFDYAFAGDYANAFESFSMNLVRGVVDPINIASGVVGLLSGGAGAAALQGATGTARKAAIQAAMKSLAAGFITDTALTSVQEVGQQNVEIEAKLRDNVDYGEAMVNGLVQGVVGQVPAVGAAVYRGLRPRKFSDSKSWREATESDDVVAKPTAPMEVIEEARAKVGLKKSINLTKIPEDNLDDYNFVLDQMQQHPGWSKYINKPLSQLSDVETEFEKGILKARAQGLAVTPDAVTALRFAAVESFNDAKLLNKEIDSLVAGGMRRDSELVLDLLAARNHAWFQSQALLARTSETAANASAVLAVHRRTLKSRFEIRAAFEASQKAKTDKEISDVLRQEGYSPTLAEKSAQIADKSVKMFMEAWYNGILGAFDTIAINAVGSYVNGAMKYGLEKPLAQAIAASMRAIGMNPATKKGEAQAALSGFMGAHTDAIRMSLHMAASERAADNAMAKVAAAEAKIAELRAKGHKIRTSKELKKQVFQKEYYKNLYTKMNAVGSSEFGDETLQGHIPWWLLGPVVRVPGRLMNATDAANRTLGYAAAQNSIAHRKAVQEGLDPNAKDKKARDAFERRVNELKRTPTEGDLKQIRAEMETMVFQENNGFSDLVRSAQNNRYAGPVVRLFIPFARTPANILIQGAKRTPILGFIGKDVPIEERLGRQIVGGTLIALGYAAAEAGLITGGGSGNWQIDRGRADTSGYIPYAMVGETDTGVPTYKNISRYDPIALLAQFGAFMKDIKDYIQRIPEGKDREEVSALRDAMYGEMLVASQYLVVDRSFMAGIADIGKFITGELNVPQWAAQTLSNIIPNYVSRNAQTFDDFRRMSGQSGDFINSLGDKLANRSGIGRDDLPVAYNDLGRPIAQSQGLLFSLEGKVGDLVATGRRNVSQVENFPEDAGIVNLYNRLAIPSPPPPKEFNGVALTDWERSRYQQIGGTQFRESLRVALPYLENLVANGNEGLARKQVMELKTDSFKFAKTYLMMLDTEGLTEGRREEFMNALVRTKYDGVFHPDQLRIPIDSRGFKPAPEQEK